MFKNKNKRIVLFLAAGLISIFLLALSGCAAITQNEAMDTGQWATPEEPASAPAPMPPMADGSKTMTEPGVAGESNRDMAVAESPTVMPDVDATERKIIKSAYMGLDTLEFERTTDAIVGKATAMGGFVESSSVQGTRLVDKGLPSRRQANFQIRIPEEHFEGFMTAIGDLGVVTVEQIMGQDITGQYFDTETRVRTLTMQEERLLSLLAKAEELTDILEIERELSRIRFEIENLSGTLKNWDSLVQFSRVSIDVYEVDELIEIEPDPETWLDRIIEAFRDSLMNLGNVFINMIVFLVSALPYLLILGVLGWFVWKTLRTKTFRGKIKGGSKDEQNKDEQ